MRKLLVVIVLFAISMHIAAQELIPVFGPFINVTPTNSMGSTRPRIALVNDSIPIVMWSALGPPVGHMWVARWNGTGFALPVMIAPAMDIYTSNEEGGDIAARGDTAYIVFFTTDSKCYSVHSYDAGLTWSDTVRVDHQTARYAYTPNVEIDANGNPVVLFEVSDTLMMMNPGHMICRSYDGGMTFTNEQFANANLPGIPCECCPPELLINDSMTYAIYRNNDNNRRDIVMSISSDSGITFPLVSEPDQTNWTTASCPTAGADAAFYRDSVVMVWKSQNKIWYGCGDAQSGAAGADNLLEPTLGASIIQKHPVVEAKGDTVVYLWDDRRNNSSYDCFISISGDGVHPVTTPFIVNDTAGTADVGTQQTPHAVMEGNKIHIVYQNAPQGRVVYRLAVIGGGVGIEEQQPAKVSPAIFPVPVTESFTVSGVEGTCTVEIFAMNGDCVSTTANVISGQVINCSNLACGAYTVVITTEAGVKTSLPLIKQ